MNPVLIVAVALVAFGVLVIAAGLLLASMYDAGDE